MFVFALNITEACFRKPQGHCQQVSIGSGNGLLPYRQQAIIGNNDALIH